jgi:hypothetical protein
MEVNDYYLIFDLNGVLVVTGEDQTRSRLVVLRHGLKEFLYAYVKKFMMYIWSLAMKRNFSRHLDIVAEKTCFLLPSSRILDQTLCLKNYHFLRKKFNKPIFHKNLKDFFKSFSWYSF